jgi:U3 small nucleolar RNA-associated protein 15
MVAGDNSGLIQIFDASSRAILRSFSEHSAAVHLVQFCAFNPTMLVSGSDDCTVKLWDMPSEAALHTFECGDYVRSVSSSQSGLIAAGSYDGFVRVWNAETKVQVLNVAHGAPVECVLFHPSGGIVISAGDNYIKLWSLVSSSLIKTISNHQKTITCLAVDGEGRIVSAGLDGFVKVYSPLDYSILYSAKYPAPILSLGVSDAQLVVGMSTGVVSVKTRSIRSNDLKNSQKRVAENVQTASFKYWIRGATSEPSHAITTPAEKKVHLKDYDKLLKQFQYSAALDSVLSPSPPLPPVIVVSLLEELIARDGLRSALSGRDDVGLERIVKFVAKYITHPRWSSLLIDVTNVILGTFYFSFG